MKQGEIEDQKSDCIKTNMNINYMIIQAREQVNEAIQNLTSKDQNISHLQIERMQKQIDAEAAEVKNQDSFLSTDVDSQDSDEPDSG